MAVAFKRIQPNFAQHKQFEQTVIDAEKHHNSSSRLFAAGWLKYTF